MQYITQLKIDNHPVGTDVSNAYPQEKLELLVEYGYVEAIDDTEEELDLDVEFDYGEDEDERDESETVD